MTSRKTLYRLSYVLSPPTYVSQKITCVCVCVCPHVCVPTPWHTRGDEKTALLYCVSPGVELGLSRLQQAPLPSEPACQPFYLSLKHVNHTPFYLKSISGFSLHSRKCSPFLGSAKSYLPESPLLQSPWSCLVLEH